MTILRLVAAQAPAYRALMLEAYEAHPEAFTSAVGERARMPLSWWETRLGGDGETGERILGALHDDVLAGVAGLGFNTGAKTSHKARLFGTYVAAPFRRVGLAHRLVQAAVAEAAGRTGVQVVQLTVTEGNLAASRLYERNGFRAYGIEPLAVAVDDGFVSKIHMWRDLAGVRG